MPYVNPARVCLILGLLLPGNAFGAPGDLDAGFGVGGIARIDLGTAEAVSCVKLDSSNRILVAGGMDGDFFIARLKKNGTLDVGNFGVDYDNDMSPDGFVTFDVGGNEAVAQLVLDSNDVIYAVGTSIDALTFDERNVVARFLANGQIDTSFGTVNTPGFVYSCLHGTAGDAVGDSSNNIHVYSTLQLPGLTSRGAYSIVSATGTVTVDCTQNSPSGGTQGEGGEAIVIQPSDERIIVAGHMGADVYLTRFLANSSSKDNSFDTDGTAILTHLQVTGNPADTLSCADVAIDTRPTHQHYNKAILIGSTAGDFVLARFTTNGSLDSTFSGNGSRVVNFGGVEWGRAGTIDRKGRIVFAGESNGDLALGRVKVKGKLDKTFGPGLNGKVVTPFAEAVAVRSILIAPKKRILIGGTVGQFGNQDILVVRYNSQ